MSGCLPALCSCLFFMPCLFLSRSLALRRKVLWADDLSSYDSVYELFISLYDHISLFPIASVAIFIYTMMTMGNNNPNAGMQYEVHHVPHAVDDAIFL